MEVIKLAAGIAGAATLAGPTPAAAATTTPPPPHLSSPLLLLLLLLLLLSVSVVSDFCAAAL